VLEEDLQLDCAPDGLLLLPRLPYLGGERLGTVIDMLLVGDQIGGYRPSCLPAEVRRKLKLGRPHGCPQMAIFSFAASCGEQTWNSPSHYVK
jgi:hypothetical protein